MAEVTLYVYDLSDDYPVAKKALNLLPGPEMHGIWHSALVVYGKEIDYGQRGVKIEDAGVQEKELKLNNKQILGKTRYNFSTIIRYVGVLSRNQFQAKNYNVVKNNCHIFSNTLCQNILKMEIPKHLRNLPKDTFIAGIIKIFACSSHSVPALRNSGGPELYNASSRPLVKEITEKENVKH